MTNINWGHITTIGFDADDTLWVNETYFRESEHEFAKILSPYETENTTLQELFKFEMANLDLYGYGIKGFMLSMVEAAIELSNGRITATQMSEILAIGKEMLAKPVELLEGVEEVLGKLSKEYRLILITKGDLLDQERKLELSGLGKYFHHIEVVSDKKEHNYKNLLDHLEVKPSEFLMVGNSLKSDVLPLINIGAAAIHIPFHTTWAHEHVDDDGSEKQYQTLESIKEVSALLEKA